MFDEEFPVYQADRILSLLTGLAAKAQAVGSQVIYIQNDGGHGAPDEHGKPGWFIHPAFAPQTSDLVIEKSAPDAFWGTRLNEELQSRAIKRLVIAGMQTELCIYATCLGAVRLGYKTTLVEDGHSTYDADDLPAPEIIALYNRELASTVQLKKAVELAFG
jgi:nicotinamidase-related amidase